MGRKEKIAKCIVQGVSRDDEERQSSIRRALAAFTNFFALYGVPLRKHDPESFAHLRHDVWKIEEAVYMASFVTEDDEKQGLALQAMVDMGFSGSTFFSTTNEAYLVKSIPRAFEHDFFREDLLQPYVEHMTAHQDSALIRITDLLAATGPAIGIPLGMAPSHHIIMENILYGQAKHREQGGAKWQTWDLKPTSYFFPERDIAGGKLTSAETKSKLADEFNDDMVLNQSQADDLLRILESDTQLLADKNAVDYSLFLVRIALPHSSDSEDPFCDPTIIPSDAPFAPPDPPSWRTGMPSPDGKYVYRAVILDFFWAKHKLQPKFMTALIKAWNLVDRGQGPMSITTKPEEYRERFLGMCKEIIQVKGDGEDAAAT